MCIAPHDEAVVKLHSEHTGVSNFVACVHVLLPTSKCPSRCIVLPPIEAMRFPGHSPPLLLALLMRWRLIPQHSPCCSSSRLWWSQHDVGFVASADSSEISNSVPACTRAALQATHIPHANRRVRAITLARMAVACEQAENAARGSCGAQKQRVYRRCKRSETGMPNAGQRIKRNCEGECEGDSAPSSFASSMAAST